MTENNPKDHVVFNQNPYEYVDHDEVKIGDTIINITSNQEAFGIYSVVKNVDENGNVEKGLEKIEFSPSKKMTPLNDFTKPPKISNDESSILNLHWYPDSGIGGKKKHKKTQHRRKRKKISKSKKMKSKKYRRHQK